MSAQDKLLENLRQAKKTYPWNDLVSLLRKLGYQQKEMAGSRVRFYNPTTGHMIRLHRPHPENVIKGGALKDIKITLKQEGLL
ncbi:type II toxin-antitoxin system HicA family toxin [Methylohalobius crimeensis]|uniref:type II toxin-antitoxin system HicA family toxin n=1 Tax=Methylohalobius crimeensis TaxID=244365 RepID=UPI000419D4B8|nr:type II toxin-antitoxin system HicA family toxin [Methylohalobius crimeensis]